MKKHLCTLLMTMVMMAISPAMMWAENPEPLVVGNNPNLTIDRGYTYFSFSVETAGHYKFTSSENDISIECGEYIISQRHGIAYFDADNYTVSLSNCGSGNEITTNLNIAPYTIPTLTTDGTTIARIEALSYLEHVYAFTAPADGTYTFTTDNEDLYVNVFDSTPYQVADMGVFSGVNGVECTAGCIYYVEVGNPSESISYEDVSVTVSEGGEGGEGGENPETLVVGDNPGLTLNPGLTQFSFSVETAGHYKFTSSHPSVFVACSSYPISDVHGIAYLGADTYTVELNNFDESESTITTDLNIAPYTVPTLTIDGTTIARIEAGSYLEHVYAFTAPDDGTYTFTTDNEDLYVEVFDSTPYQLADIGVFSGVNGVECTAGNTYYVHVSNPSESISYENVTLTVGEKYVLQVLEAEWATMYLPFAVEAAGGTKVYTATFNQDESALVLTPQEQIPAYTPVIVYASFGGHDFQKIDYEADLVETPLYGVTVETSYDDIRNATGKDILTLGKSASSEVGFHSPSNPYGALPANKCCLLRDNSSSNASVRLVLDETTSLKMNAEELAAIKQIVNNTVFIIRNGQMYDAHGRIVK